MTCHRLRDITQTSYSCAFRLLWSWRSDLLVIYILPLLRPPRCLCFSIWRVWYSCATKPKPTQITPYPNKRNKARKALRIYMFIYGPPVGMLVYRKIPCVTNYQLQYRVAALYPHIFYKEHHSRLQYCNRSLLLHFLVVMVLTDY